MVHGSNRSLKRRNRRSGLILSLSLLIIFGLVFTSSCGTTKLSVRHENDIIEELMETSTDFNKLLKWGAYDKMTPLIHPDDKEAFIIALDRVETKLHIEEIQIASTRITPLDPDSEEAKKHYKEQTREARVIIKMINITKLPDNRVTTRRYTENWVYKDGSWYVKLDLEELLK